jgi:urease accessory protein UreE
MSKRVTVNYPIEEGIAIPVKVASKSIPIQNLEVGQSLLFPLDRRSYVQTKASRLKSDEGRLYEVHKVDNKNCRIWRKK